LAKFEYKEQWARDTKFKDARILALLGSGFDPGVTSVFCAYAQQYLFDEINYIDILDCNAGEHGYAFATNFNPEINLREVSANGRYWQEGKWIETKPMEIMMKWDYPEVGIKDSYLTHMKCLENVGMLRIDEVEVNGVKVIPIELLAKPLEFWPC